MVSVFIQQLIMGNSISCNIVKSYDTGTSLDLVVGALALAVGVRAVARSAKKHFSRTKEQDPTFAEQQEDAPLKQEISNEKNVNPLKEETLIIDDNKRNVETSNEETKANNKELSTPKESWFKNVSNFIGAIPSFFTKTIPSCFRRVNSWIWSIPGKISYVWNFATSSEGKTVPLKTQEQIDQEAKEKYEEILRRDLGIPQDGYDRDFLSSKGKKSPDLDDDARNSNPISSTESILLKLHEQGEDNCKNAFRDWQETNAEISIISQEKHKLAEKNAELEIQSQKVKGWVQIGIIAIGIVGTVIAAATVGVVAAAITTAATVFIFIAKHLSGDAVAGIITAKADLAVKQNQNNINLMDTKMKAQESKLSIISQDMSRFYQTNSTIISILQTIIRTKQESRQAIAGNLR